MIFFEQFLNWVLCATICKYLLCNLSIQAALVWLKGRVIWSSSVALLGFFVKYFRQNITGCVKYPRQIWQVVDISWVWGINGLFVLWRKQNKNIDKVYCRFSMKACNWKVNPIPYSILTALCYWGGGSSMVIAHVKWLVANWQNCWWKW